MHIMATGARVNLLLFCPLSKEGDVSPVELAQYTLLDGYLKLVEMLMQTAGRGHLWQ